MDKHITKPFIELNKNKLAVDEEEYNSKKFDIKFSEKVGKLSPTQFEVNFKMKQQEISQSKMQ